MPARPTVVLVGALDTKGREYGFVRDRLRDAGCDVVLVDTGVLGDPPVVPDVSAAEVARAAGVELGDLRFDREGSDKRALALATMERGATAIVDGLRRAGRCDGVMGMGGSGGSTVVSGVLRSLPVGVPKLLVSTLASGDTRTFVGTSDVTLVYPITDIQGLNRVARHVLANAAHAMAGMALRSREAQAAANGAPTATAATADGSAPLVALTMMGVTTPGVQRMQERLEAAGFETIVFHATGSGGRAMEEMIEAGLIDGVIDVTTAEVTAELLGGILSSGPHRLEAAGRLGIPQVISTGALDVINFGPLASVPAAFAGPERQIVVHNPSITSIRVTADEGAAAGRVLAAKANAATGPTAVLLPLGGSSKYQAPGGPFAEPPHHRAMFAAIRESLADHVECRELDANINDPSFADAAVETFLALWARRRDRQPG